MVADCWFGLPLRILGIRIDASMMMPSHFHGILWIQDGPPRSRPTVARAIMAFKSVTTVAYIHGVRALGWPPFAGRLWHRSHYDRIIYGPAPPAPRPPHTRALLTAHYRPAARQIHRRPTTTPAPPTSAVTRWPQSRDRAAARRTAKAATTA